MKLLCSIAFLFLVISCTVTKRIHRPGWHVEWKKHHQTAKAHEIGQLCPETIEVRVQDKMVSATSKKGELMNEEHADSPVGGAEDTEEQVSNRLETTIAVVENRVKQTKVQNLSQEDDLRMFDDRKSFTLLLFGLTILLIGVVVLLAVPSVQVEIVALWLLLLLVGAFLVALSFLLHTLWKVQQRNEEKRKRYRTTRERKRTALWVVMSIFGTIAMLGITLYLATLVGEFLVAGIIFLVACTIMSSLLFEQYVKGWTDQSNRISSDTERALILLFVSVAIATVVLVLFALNGWLLIPAAAGMNLGFAIAATILGFGALIVALIGLGTLVEALDW